MDTTSPPPALARRLLACLVLLVAALFLVPLAAFADADDALDAASGIAVAPAASDGLEGPDVFQPADDAVAQEGAWDYESVARTMAVDAAAAVPMAAESTLACGNGWVLGIAPLGEGVAVSGVEKTGSGALAIPDSADGAAVVAIADRAFMDCAALSSVTLPASVASLGQYAFYNSGVSSINIPAAVSRIPYRCFAQCASLEKVSFEGDTLDYLSQMSFAYCTSLKKIEIPLLVAYPTRDQAQADGLSDGAVDFFACVGQGCFLQCSQLSEIVFGGPVVPNPKTYLVNTSCLAGCAPQLLVVCKGATVSIPSGTSSAAVISATSLGYTLDFYDSLEAAESLEGRLASVTYHALDRSRAETGAMRSTLRVQLVPLLQGAKDYSSSLYAGSADMAIPACPEGKVWGVVGAASEYPTTTTTSTIHGHSYMAGSYRIAAVDRADVTYAWISSPSIEAFNSTVSPTSATGMGTTNAYPRLYMQADGSIPELSEIGVRATDGSMVDSSAYTLHFQKATITPSRNGGTTTTWPEEGSSIGIAEVKEPGLYRVYAQGVGDHAQSVCEAVAFRVIKAAPKVTTYYDSGNISAYLGKAAYDAAFVMDATPAYNVLAPAGDWRNQLLGLGFAGAGAGLLLADCSPDYSNNMMQAAMQSGTDSYIIVGDKNAVPQSADMRAEAYLADFAAERTGTFGTRYGEGTQTARDLAQAALSKFKPASWNAQWGTYALVVSPTDELIGEAAAQYAYQNRARVFFLNDDGTLDAEVAGMLAASDISQVVIVGDASSVSASVASTIASRTGKTPTRILEGSNACSASLALARQMVQAGTASYDTVVVADSSDPENVSSAAVLAQALGGVMLTCRTSADAQAIEAFFEGLITQEGLQVVSDLRLVGNFIYLDDAEDAFAQAWSKSAASLNTTGAVSLAVGDTFEVEGFVYQISGGQSATVLAATGAANTASAPAQVSFAGTTYNVSHQASTWKRLGGSTRYETMKLISSEGYRTTDTVVVASGQAFPDALSATSLAGLYDCPVLLSKKASLSEQARSEIRRLGCKQAIIVGGPAALSERVESDLKSLVGSVTRIAGANRTETALRVYEQGRGQWGSDAIVAYSKSFADALSISPYAYARKAPIILTGGDGKLTAAGRAALAGFDRVLIIGGTAVVSGDTEGVVGTKARRLAGANRYATSQRVARFCLDEGMGANRMAVAYGGNFPDALAGGALCGSTDSIIMLASAKNSGRVCDMVNARRYTIGQAYVLGGTAVVSDALLKSFEDASAR